MKGYNTWSKEYISSLHYDELKTNCKAEDIY